MLKYNHKRYYIDMAKQATRKQRKNKAPIFIIFFFILAIIATIIVLKIFKIIDQKGKPSSNSQTNQFTLRMVQKKMPRLVVPQKHQNSMRGKMLISLIS